MYTRHIVILGTIFLVVASTASIGQAQTQAQIYDSAYQPGLLQKASNYQGITNLPYIAAKIMPGVVTIHAFGKSANGSAEISQGSGFFITPHDVITCYHVIDVHNLSHITVQSYVPLGMFPSLRPFLTVFPSQMFLPVMYTYPASISEEYANFDLARLTVQSPGPNPYLLVNNSPPMLGEDLAVFGSPEGKYFTVSKGIISGFRWPYEVNTDILNHYSNVSNDRTPVTPENYGTTALELINLSKQWPYYIQFDAPASQGSSGGPLVNSNGEVIGIDDKFHPWENAENLNFAIPSIYFVSVMQKMPITYIAPNMTEINSAEGWFNQGFALNNLGRYDEGLQAYDKAIQLKPDYAMAWYNKGWTLDQQGKYDEAIKAFNKSIELNPDYAEAWGEKGYVLGQQGKYDEELQALDKAIQLKPDYVWAWFNKGWILDKQGKYDEAIKALDKSIELKPDYAEAWGEKGYALGQQGKYDEELQALDKAIQLKPDYALGWNNKGWALKSLGRTTEADLAYAKANELGYTSASISNPFSMSS